MWLYRANLITKSDDVTLDPSYVADNSRRELYYSAIQQKSSAVHFNFIFSLILHRVQVLARLFLVLMLTSSCLHCARQCSHETIDFTWCFYFSPCFILTTRFLLCLSRPKLSTQPWNFNFCFVWLLNYFHDEDNFTTTKLLRFAFAENLNTKFTDSQSLCWLLCTIIWRKRLRLFAAGRRKLFQSDFCIGLAWLSDERESLKENSKVIFIRKKVFSCFCFFFNRAKSEILNCAIARELANSLSVFRISSGALSSHQWRTASHNPNLREKYSTSKFFHLRITISKHLEIHSTLLETIATRWSLLFTSLSEEYD